MKKILFILLSTLLLSSCNFIDRKSDGHVVAKIENKVLYKTDTDPLIPKNISPEDSLRMLEQYIYSWAGESLILSKAESSLSKEEKREIEKELANYRNSLIAFKYEKKYLDQRLDTLITETECVNYYQNDLKNFVNSYSIIKGRYIRISTASPSYQIIRSLYKSIDYKDIIRLDSLCANSAEFYTNFNESWVTLPMVAKDLRRELESLETDLSKQNWAEYERDNKAYLLVVYEKVSPNEVSPYEYNRNMIREAILSKRKQELILTMERDLLKNAINNRELIININE